VLIKYCSDIFRPELLTIFSELDFELPEGGQELRSKYVGGNN